MQIDISKLQLIPYVGAGNRTPVLDISSAVSQEVLQLAPAKVRSLFEDNKTFRRWLQREGKKLRADTVMIYYPSSDKASDFVTFVGEPNAAVDASFSDMCGNGIRCLGLHILLQEKDRKMRERYRSHGIKIMAGDMKTIRFEKINIRRKTARVTVDMGVFRSDKNHLASFAVLPDVVSHSLHNVLLPAAFLPDFLKDKAGGIGFNGDTEGEPHLVFLYTKEEFMARAKQYGFSSLSQNALLHRAIRQIVCAIGNQLTFNLSLFPKGINVNLGVVVGNTIYMATHERNLLPSQNACLTQQKKHIFCQCNTMACGTGGAALSNIARLHGLTRGDTIQTIHPGGDITYVIGHTTTMIGSAEYDKYMDCLNKESEVK